MAFAAVNMSAATFLVPSDETLVRASKAIVVATAGDSYCRYAPGGWIETVTTLYVDEAIKGPVETGDAIQVTELGGEVGPTAYIVAGSPRYAPGERVLLFLETNDRGEWVSKDMAIGKFAFAGSLLVRDSDELVGWDVDTGRPHREGARDAGRFLRFVRDVAAGRSAISDYSARPQPLRPAPNAAAASTYCMTISGLPVRWDRFPTAVVFLSDGTQPGALGGGLTALQRAFAAWDGAPGANVNYQYGGTTAARSGFVSADGIDSVQFNDPSNEIPGSFQLQTGAVLAIGGVWAGSDTHTFAGETFRTITEADLVIQDGISGPGLTGNGFDHVVTHELGHTLGLRHSDQPPAGGTSTTIAIMNSSVDFNNDTMGSTLQAWDIEAIDAVYGGGGGGVTPPPPSCNAPSITTQPQSVAIINTPANISVSATGDVPLRYQWYIGASGNTSQAVPNANAALLTIQPAVTTQYWVQVTNKCGSANSNTATVTVNGCPPVIINSVSPNIEIIEGKTTTLAVDAAGGAGLTFQWFIGNPGNTGTPIGSGSSITVQPKATTSYWVRITNNCGAFADSVLVAVTVQPCDAPAIVVQPSGGNVLNGTSVSLYVGDTGTKPENYQWFEGAKGDTSKPVNAASLASFNTPRLLASTSFWVRITNDCGTADSDAAQLTVVSTCTAPQIVSQPEGQTINSGSSAMLSVTATGTSLAYQWYQGPVFDFTHPVGGNAPVLVTPQLTAATPFFVRISSPCGSLNSVSATVSTSSRRRPSRG